MQQATATDLLSDAGSDTAFARPQGARQAYGKVIRQAASPRDIEYRVFAEVTQELRDATPDIAPNQRAAAIDRNRALWQTLGYMAGMTGNKLPMPLRASIVSLSIWVTRESSRLLRDNAAFDALIETNTTIMQGLNQATGGDVPCP